MTDISEAPACSDFLYWRRPLTETPLGTSSGFRSDRITDWRSDERDLSAASAGYSDFLFWRRPLVPYDAPWIGGHNPPTFSFGSTPSPPPVAHRTLSAVSVGAAAPSPRAVPSSPAAYADMTQPALPPVDASDRAHGGADHSDDDMGSAGDPSLLRMLQGGSGARLVSLLSGISSRLGSSSRFAAAADRLRADVFSLRESQPDASALARPYGGTTMQDTQVARAVGSMLRTLDHGALSPVAGIAVRGARELVPAVGPASPHAVRALEVLSGQGLPELGPADSCTICLEPMLGCAQLLRMPCSLAHTYHRVCLTQWLQTSSSCPLCRERLAE